MARIFLFALLCFLTLLPVVVVSGERKNLYPACDGNEYNVTAASGSKTEVYKFSTQAQAMKVSCLAYEVISVPNPSAKDNTDHCLVAHQTTYKYTISLRAVYKDNVGVLKSQDFFIHDMTGGSLAELIARVPYDSSFSIIFSNNADNSLCTLQLRMIFSAAAVVETVQEVIVPTVISMEPRTAYSNSGARSYILLDHSSSVPFLPSDTVTLVDFSLGSCDPNNGEALNTDYTSKLPSTMEPYSGHFYTIRTVTFYKPGSYRMCYRPSGRSTAVEIATISVFSGNPSYYEFVGGQMEDGNIRVGVKTTIQFHGYDLNTQKDGDQAKFVNDWEDCSVGSPAGGVELATDLEPEDNYGPFTTYSLWTWVMEVDGAYKVCYRRKVTGQWTEVPLISDIQRLPNNTDNTADIPVPTNPTTHEECSMAVVNSQIPWARYKAATITLSVASIPENFIDNLMHLLCVPRGVFSIIHRRQNAHGKQVVYVALNCDDVSDTSGVKVCDTTERLNYFISLNGLSNLTDTNITNVEGTTSMFAFPEDRDDSSGTSSWLSIFLMLTIVGLLVALLVTKAKKRQNRFVQFGLDEDIDDMYNFGSAPSPGVNYNDQSFEINGQRRIKDAVIEMEE